MISRMRALHQDLPRPAMIRSQIVGTGRALPRQVMTNEMLCARMNCAPEDIQRRTGVKTRYWVKEGETCSMLAAEAATEALKSAHLSHSEVGLIIVSTTSPDFIFPSTACRVQQMLGASRAAAFDIGASCTGFLYALSIADQYIRNQAIQYALVIAAEVKSVFLDPTDFATAILFGDGAGAVVLSKGKVGIRTIRLHAEGTAHHLVRLPAGGSRQPLTATSLRDRQHYMRMDGPSLFRKATYRTLQIIAALLAENPQINWALLHQANLRMLNQIFKKNPNLKSHLTIQKWGNTSSASLPMALDDAVRLRQIKPGDCVALCAVGGGMTWGAAVVDWTI